MRIAVISNAYPPHLNGGAAQIAATYTEALQSRGHETRVWQAKPAFFELGRKSAFSRLFFHIADLGVQKRMVADLLEWKPDVVISHNLTGCGFATPKHIARTGVRWIHVLHDVQLVEPSGQIRADEAASVVRFAWRNIWAALRRMALGRPDVVVSPTEWLLKFHSRFGFFSETRTQVIPNPVRLNVPEDVVRDPLQVCYAGRIDEDKGLLVLLDAWSRVEAFASKLVCIGIGTLLTQLRESTPESVEFLGSRPQDRVVRKMAESGVVVVPSLILENQPTVILEALAAGCSVVASDVGGARETLGEAGWIVSPGDVEALSRALREALEHPELHKGSAPAVLAQHELSSCVQRFEALLVSNL